MPLFDLFRPKWKHSDWQVRKAQVDALANEAAEVIVRQIDPEAGKQQAILMEIATADSDSRIREAAFVALLKIAKWQNRPSHASQILVQCKPSKELFESFYTQVVHGSWSDNEFEPVFEEYAKSVGFDVVPLLLEQLKSPDRDILGVCYKTVARLESVGDLSALKSIIVLGGQCGPSELKGRCILACTNFLLRCPDEVVQVLQAQEFSDAERDVIRVAVGMATTHSHWEKIQARWEGEGRLQSGQRADFGVVMSLPPPAHRNAAS